MKMKWPDGGFLTKDRWCSLLSDDGHWEIENKPWMPTLCLRLYALPEPRLLPILEIQAFEFNQVNVAKQLAKLIDQEQPNAWSEE